NRDLIAWRLHDGVWQGPIGGAAWLRPWDSALKDLLRLLLRPYFAGLALAAVAFAIGSGWNALTLSLAGTAREGQGEGGQMGAARRPAADRPALDSLALLSVATLAALTVIATGLIADRLLERMPHV